jgi:quercetin dioxygenase-like cupin family protein
MKGNMNNTSSPLTAFKRAPSLGLSQWESGNLTTNLAEKKDTNGAFFLVEAMLAPGTEPPPHVHTREDELFYVLEGEFDVYVGKEAFKVKTGECVFLPRFRPHAFVMAILSWRRAISHTNSVIPAPFLITTSSCSRLRDSKGFSGRHRFRRRTTRLLQPSHRQLPFGVSSNSPPTVGFSLVDRVQPCPSKEDQNRDS